MKKLISLLLLGTATFTSARASEPTTCFEFELSRSPERSLVTSDRETWCYRGDAQHLFVFPADEANWSLESMAWIERDARGRRIVAHGSLFRGTVEIHKSFLRTVEPLPVPTDLTRAALQGQPVREAFSRESENRLEALARQLRQAPLEGSRWKLQAGTIQSQLPNDKLPYAAYWWPFIGLTLASGPNSPLGKYDAYVQAVTGTNPGAHDWEKSNHSTQVVKWGGHCNGWAAQTYLYPKTSGARWDASQKRVIFASDIDGMLSEASFCADYAFYGLRYNGTTDDIKDISPALFQEVLVYYVDTLKKPVAFDQFADDEVDNNIFSGYTIKTEAIAGKPNEFNVTATVRAHAYPQSRDERLYSARAYSVIYDYTLVTDGNGNVVSGTWKNENYHPDFMWVPTAQRKCAGENPNIDPAQALAMKNLPSAVLKSVPVNFSLGRKLKGGEQVQIPIPEIRGAQIRLKLTNNLKSYVYLPSKIVDDYPTNGGALHVGSHYAQENATSVDLKASELKELWVSNPSDKETPGDVFVLHSIEYLGEP